MLMRTKQVSMRRTRQQKGSQERIGPDRNETHLAENEKSSKKKLHTHVHLSYSRSDTS